MRGRQKEENPLLGHWICKDCEVMNGNDRNRCLQCDELRGRVQITDHEIIRQIRKKWGFNASPDSPKPHMKIKKQKYICNNGEYP